MSGSNLSGSDELKIKTPINSSVDMGTYADELSNHELVRCSSSIGGSGKHSGLDIEDIKFTNIFSSAEFFFVSRGTVKILHLSRLKCSHSKEEIWPKSVLFLSIRRRFKVKFNIDSQVF